jgi:polyphosphate kinase
VSPTECGGLVNATFGTLSEIFIGVAIRRLDLQEILKARIVGGIIVNLLALPAPSDHEKSQLYLQRYMQHFPAAGEVVTFDRSWYNRAGVEYVLGYCTKEQHRRFLELCPPFEKVLVENGIHLIKYWLEVGHKEQKRRFEARIEGPLRQWKLKIIEVCTV